MVERQDETHPGGCACGAVRYTVRGAIEEAHHCHCSTCRRVHGAAFATFARTTRLVLHSGAERLTRYRSTPPVSRSFCAACGSSLFFEHDAVPQFTWVAAGTFDDGAGLRPDAHVFVDTKAPWWSIEDALSRYGAQRPEYARKS